MNQKDLDALAVRLESFIGSALREARRDIMSTLCRIEKACAVAEKCGLALEQQLCATTLHGRGCTCDQTEPMPDDTETCSHGAMFAAAMNPGPIREVQKDPWAHRSAKMTCAACMWYVPKEQQTIHTISGVTKQRELGRCRRHAPTMSGYPVVYPSDWCGDHKLDETKA